MGPAMNAEVHTNGNGVVEEEYRDGLSGAELFSNANGCARVRVERPARCRPPRSSPRLPPAQTRTRTTSSYRVTSTSVPTTSAPRRR